MTTLAAALANAAQRWTVVLRVEGVGPGLTSSEVTAADGDGRVRFCSFVPTFASGEPSTLWRPLLAELPTLLSERADPLGGSQELGAVSFRLVDVGDYLTQLLRTERAPTTAIVTAASDTATILYVGSTSALAEDTAIFVGAEAMRIASVDSGTQLTVERGYLGTVPAAHSASDRVFLSTPILETRRVAVQLYPIDADDAGEFLEVGTFAIDSLDWDSDANVWSFACSSQLQHLGRLVPYRPQTVVVAPNVRLADFDANRDAFTLQKTSNEGQNLLAIREWLGTEADPSHLFYLQFENEVVSIENDGAGYIGPYLRILRRDVTGAGKQAQLAAGSIGQRVFVARTGTGSDAGSFRFSPGPSPSTSRSSGTWTRTAHWIDLLLILMTSSHDDADGLELTNYLASGTDRERSNWSSLPSGYGLGMPIDQIDVASFLAVKDRTLEFELPNFTFGAKVETFADLIEREFLKPMGAFLSVQNGVAKLVLPKVPLADSASLTLGPADILTREVGPGLLSPRISVSRGSGSLVSDLVYELGPGAVPLAITDASFADTFGGRGVFNAAGPALRIAVPGADPDSVILWSRRAIPRLWRAHRPRMTLKADLLPSATAWEVGDIAAITIPELVNMRDATRGWDSMQAQLLERSLVLDAAPDGNATGAYLDTKAQIYGPEARVGRIAPAAHVTGSAGSVATCTANRYTQADAYGLPTTDVGAFTVGDVVTLCDAAGVINGAAGTETVVSIDEGLGEIEFSGDFNGELGADVIIVYASAGSASTTQRNRYTYLADKASQTISGSGDPAWVYGE